MRCYVKEYYQWAWDIQRIVFFKYNERKLVDRIMKFVQIEGTDKAEPYVLTPGSDEPKSVSVS